MADNLEREKINDAAKENVIEENSDEVLGIASFMLKELSTQNKRLENASIRQEEANKRQQKVIYFLITTIIALFAGFLLFLYQYDFVSYTQDGNGYNNINTGEQGDVINGSNPYNSEEEQW